MSDNNTQLNQERLTEQANGHIHRFGIISVPPEYGHSYIRCVSCLLSKHLPDHDPATCEICRSRAPVAAPQGATNTAMTRPTERGLIEEVEELLAKATPKWEQSQLAPGYVISLSEGHEIIMSFCEYREDGTPETVFKNAENNMALTIRAPELLRRLVEELQQERTEKAVQVERFNVEWAMRRELEQKQERLRHCDKCDLCEDHHA